MYHVPMCAVCGEYEVGTFEAYDEYYCSDLCADVAFEDAGEEYKEHFDGLLAAQYDGDADAYLSQWDDDPSPYDGTYSEE